MGSELAPTAAPALTQGRWSFLTAQWRNVCLFTYSVSPERLQPLLPPGLELDLLQGQAHVSLVAFDFLDTRVLGIPWPGHRNFPEVNLRFYVREGERRGVVFVRELVPRRLIAWLARALYNEPYARAAMHSRHASGQGQLEVEHTVEWSGRAQRLRVVADGECTVPPSDSREHFFKEHFWGYGTTHRGGLARYEVRHRTWATHAVRSHELDWDFGAVYGDEWADLNDARPCSVVLAEGSTIRVSPTF